MTLEKFSSGMVLRCDSTRAMAWTGKSPLLVQSQDTAGCAVLLLAAGTPRSRYLLGTAGLLCRCPRHVLRVPGPQAVLVSAALQLREPPGQPGQPGPDGRHVLLGRTKDSLDLRAERATLGGRSHPNPLPVQGPALLAEGQGDRDSGWLPGSHRASLTSSTRSWMKRREEPEPLRAPWASSSTVLARCRVPTTSSTLPSTALARFLGKGGKQPGVSVAKGTDWKSRSQR